MNDLRKELEMLKERAVQRMPENITAKFNEAIAELKAIEASFGLPVGFKAPNFTLENQAGTPIELAQILKEEIVVLFFYRGDWCPYCNLQLAAYQEMIPTLEFHGARLVAVNPQLPDKSMGLAEKHQLGYDILSDVDLAVADAFKIKFSLPDYLQTIYKDLGLDLEVHNANHKWELPLAATFIIDKNGTIISRFIDTDYKNRMEPKSILEVLEALPKL